MENYGNGKIVSVVGPPPFDTELKGVPATTTNNIPIGRPSTVPSGYNHSLIDTYRQRGFLIEFQGTANIKNKIVFSAMLKSFVDEYSSEWNSENIFGFWDQVHIFKQTKRKINFGIDIPSVDEGEAEINFRNVRLLGKSLYPTYESVKGNNIIDKSPLMRIRFSNLISDKSETKGLFGKIDSISISPSFEAGFFDVATGVLYPKLMQLDITFDVIHTEDPISVSNEVKENAKITGVKRLENPQFSDGSFSVPIPKTDSIKKTETNPGNGMSRRAAKMQNWTTDHNRSQNEQKVFEEITGGFSNLISYSSTGKEPDQEDETTVLRN